MRCQGVGLDASAYHGFYLDNPRGTCARQGTRQSIQRSRVGLWRASGVTEGSPLRHCVQLLLSRYLQLIARSGKDFTEFNHQDWKGYLASACRAR